MRTIVPAATATRLVAIVLLAVLPAVPAAAADLWVFGDSNVDTGWYRVSPYSGNPSFDFDLALSSTYGIGEPTNNPGPMSVEWLSRLLNTTTNASPANQGGGNYATSGAKNVDVNTSANGGFPNAVPTVTQIANFIDAHPRRSVAQDVVVVDSGANDITYATSSLSGFSSAQQTAYLTARANNLAAAVKILHLRGTPHIIVVGQPESFGTSAEQSARQVYDTSLKRALDSKHVRYAWADADQVRKDLIAHPETFGIVHTSNAAGDVACSSPDPVLGIDTAWALLCSASSPVSRPTAFADATLFADDQHWSAQAQSALGTYLFCLAVTSWPQLRPAPPRRGLPPPRTRLPFPCDSFSEFSTR